MEGEQRGNWRRRHRHKKEEEEEEQLERNCRGSSWLGV